MSDFDNRDEEEKKETCLLYTSIPIRILTKRAQLPSYITELLKIIFR